MTDEELRVRAIQELEFYKKDDTFMLADITVDLAIEALEQQRNDEDFVKHEKEILEGINKREREIDKYIKKLEALEQETSIWQFAKWVAIEIFDENWEYNKDAFAEIACRKLTKLGIVRAKGGEWELVELQERSSEE